MATEVKLKARLRSADELGSGACGKMRRAGFVPATLYGHGKDPRSVAVPALELNRALHKSGLNVLLSLEFEDGSQELVLPREVDRHSVRDHLVHLDFLLVSRSEMVTAEVPVLLVGEPIGVQLGGVLQQQLNTLSVLAPVSSIPSSIEVDVSALEVGDAITAGDMVVPEGVEVAADADSVVASVVPTSATRQAEGEGGLGEGEEGEGEG